VVWAAVMPCVSSIPGFKLISGHLESGKNRHPASSNSLFILMRAWASFLDTFARDCAPEICQRQSVFDLGGEPIGGLKKGCRQGRQPVR